MEESRLYYVSIDIGRKHCHLCDMNRTQKSRRERAIYSLAKNQKRLPHKLTNRSSFPLGKHPLLPFTNQRMDGAAPSDVQPHPPYLTGLLLSELVPCSPPLPPNLLYTPTCIHNRTPDHHTVCSIYTSLFWYTTKDLP
eukprot:NODE_1420_length_867_cov_23.329730_g1374_i0.p1 GENE.NODE_1420_length_867_cov_23.329730_g1374_i0~~NODE_1420_length_867_cov_23.329730_g1374_i0.p1  ORF type:complete len:138 (-),score=2.56 NODE_1420_length_867_cov_23.329730_g1374_i0:258-671(-)